MLKWWEIQTTQYPYLKDFVFTIVVVFILLLLKKVLLKSILSKNELNPIDKTLIRKKANFYLNAVIVAIVLVLWSTQLQPIFISLFAIIAAIVVATKELIMCFTGGILVYLNKHFKPGDRIEIDNLKGYVLERTFTTTKVLEIGPEKNSQQTTGNILTFPNSLFLSKSLKNESYFQGYSINSFIFKLHESKKLKETEDFLISKAKDISTSYISSAKKNIGQFCKEEGLLIPSIEPRGKVILDGSNVSLILKMPVKNEDVASIEQDLLRSYISFLGLD